MFYAMLRLHVLWHRCAYYQVLLNAQALGRGRYRVVVEQSVCGCCAALEICSVRNCTACAHAHPSVQAQKRGIVKLR